MKKPYEKPTLVKRQKLTERTAQIIASGVILGE
ncbi:putative RiPP precursor [Mesorhizobium vachelliae]